MDWISVALAAFAGAIGAGIATALVGRWRDRPLVFVAVMIVSFTVLNVVSARFVLPHAYRMWGAAQARQSSSPEGPLTRIDDSALSLWLPGPLTPRSVSLPPGPQDSVSRFNVSTYEGDGVSIAVSHIVSKPGTPTDLDGAIAGALTNLRGMSRSADLEWSRRPWQLDGRSGAIVDVRVHAPQNELIGHALFLAEPVELWQVLILYKPEQTAGESVTTRLIESARFDRPPSTPG
jgi:hypothetical protein